MIKPGGHSPVLIANIQVTMLWVYFNLRCSYSSPISNNTILQLVSSTIFLCTTLIHPWFIASRRYTNHDMPDMKVFTKDDILIQAINPYKLFYHHSPRKCVLFHKNLTTKSSGSGLPLQVLCSTLNVSRNKVECLSTEKND